MKTKLIFGLCILLLLSGCNQKVYHYHIDGDRGFEDICECQMGCDISFMNPYHNKSNENQIEISCCYDTYRDKKGRCHLLYQDITFNVTGYSDGMPSWVEDIK